MISGCRILPIFLLFCLVSLPAADGIPVSLLTFRNSDSTSNDRYLDKSITEMVTVDLVGVQGITIIERADMEQILREQALALSGAIDETEVPEIGKLIGAKYLVFGTYTKDRRRITINYKITEVETGVIREAGTITGKIRRFMELKNKLAGSIYRSLRSVMAGLGPFMYPPDDRRITVDDVVSYGKALDLSDREDYEGARSILKNYISGDVRLSYAQRSLQQLEKRLEKYQDEHTKSLDRKAEGKLTYMKFMGVAMGYFGAGNYSKCIEFCRQTKINPPPGIEDAGFSIPEVCDYYIVASYGRLSAWDSTLACGERFLETHKGSMYFQGVKSLVYDAIAAKEKSGGGLQQVMAEVDAMIKKSFLLTGTEAQFEYFKIAGRLFNAKQWSRALDWYKKIVPSLLLPAVESDFIAYQIFLCYYYLGNRQEARGVIDFTRNNYPGSQFLDPMRRLADMIPE
ncbi:MAG: hypothetical protein JW863_23610 [Chitinispirillaceae bacterium]|nr:hypothetical protein [Chitinispirillaceae bacterium]